MEPRLEELITYKKEIEPKLEELTTFKKRTEKEPK